ncbi:Crp/Fnr family transcriptional regulator [Dactylosporangium vinaceum]|uniref:Crp/Fnr family transcriptional regulator n=1 Tax=Dactylosporangium vinaceum TaxID=53362 RepID=A0ABV5MFP9_9ACTN|nr:Crp/Fnr family transcriptional regulator [Dactylosporangium vinaceum]UAB97010.1 Crp/Fnr family transcriptional regulator [Dactylosporangium vinaceum]
MGLANTDAVKWPPGTYLHRLTIQACDDLQAIAPRRRAEPGDILIHQGALDRYVVLLQGGVFKVTALTSDGSESLLAIRVGGDLVGEMSALNDLPRSATVAACTESVYSVIHRRQLQTFLERQPSAALALAGMVADRLRWANQFRVEFTAYSAKVRVARVLVKMALAYGRWTPTGIEIGFELTQLELASLCGAAQVTVQKALRDFRRDGLIVTGYRSVTVADLAALRDAAELRGDM